MIQYSKLDLEQMCDEMLDRCYGSYEVADLLFAPSFIVKKLDPIAYSEIFNNYIDDLISSEEIYIHSDGNYYNCPEEY